MRNDKVKKVNMIREKMDRVFFCTTKENKKKQTDNKRKVHMSTTDKVIWDPLN